MGSLINDFDDLNGINHEIIKKKLYSIRNNLKISFIGKLLTPKNLLIKQLIDIDFPSYNTKKKNWDCTFISENKVSKNCNSNCEIFAERQGKKLPIENIESYLNDDVDEVMVNFKVHVSQPENSILNKCIIYNPPPIGYSEELDKFVVEQCYESCYLYVFVINAEESILEEIIFEMKIISLLMTKRKVIDLKFVIAYSRLMSTEDYIKIEQDYINKIKEITKNSPGIIIISGHGYISNGKELGDNSMDVVPKENQINDLGNFIFKNPTDELILEAVKNYHLKINSSITSKFNTNNENIKRELQNAVENIEKIINFLSKSVKSNELKEVNVQFQKIVELISLDSIYGSNYVIFGNPLITSLDILQALIGQHVSVDKTLIWKFSIIKCKFIQTNREYFVLQSDNKSIINEHYLYELNNLSEYISNLGLSANENISIELYLDNEIHPIINEEMKIIYFNDFDRNNEELLKEFDNYDEIAVILDYKSVNDKNRDIIRYFRSQHRHVKIYILVNHDEMISIDRFKDNIQVKLEIEIADVIHVLGFDYIFYKILSNLKYRNIINEIISLVQQFISHIDDKSIEFDVNIRDISDWQFQQLDDNIITKIKSIKNNSNKSEIDYNYTWKIKPIRNECKIFEEIPYLMKEEINKFINETIMENMNISDGNLLFGNKVTNYFGIEEEIQRMIIEYFDSNTTSLQRTFDKFINKVKGKCFDKIELRQNFPNFYAAKRTELRNKVNEIYISKTKEIFSNSENYKEMLKEIIDNLQRKNCKPNIIVLYQI